MAQTSAVLTKESVVGWQASVRDMPNHAGYYPVAEWTYGLPNGMRRYEIQVWVPQGLIIFRDRRGIRLALSQLKGHVVERDRHTIKFPLEVPEALLHVLVQYGLAEPPHFQEVWRDAMEAMANLPAKKKKLEKLFAALRMKWEKMLYLS